MKSTEYTYICIQSRGDITSIVATLFSVTTLTLFSFTQGYLIARTTSWASQRLLSLCRQSQHRGSHCFLQSRGRAGRVSCSCAANPVTEKQLVVKHNRAPEVIEWQGRMCWWQWQREWQSKWQSEEGSDRVGDHHSVEHHGVHGKPCLDTCDHQTVSWARIILSCFCIYKVKNELGVDGHDNDNMDHKKDFFKKSCSAPTYFAWRRKTALFIASSSLAVK